MTSSELRLDESTRPRATRYADAAPIPGGEASAQLLVQVHAHLRSELDQIRGVVAEVADGQTSPALARSLINRMAMRQNYWTLGAFCASYCSLVTTHHTIEDTSLFPGLLSRDAGLGPVIERLSEEHEVVADVLTRLDEALVAMVADSTQLEAVGSAVERLSEVLLSHLAYEEEELVPAIGRLGFNI